MISSKTESGYKIEIQSSFSDYIVIKYEGNGWSSVVFKVRRKNTNKFYAAKIISKTDMMNHNSLNDVISEITISKSLNHPNIVKNLETFEITNSKNEEFIIIIEEYCSNGSISSYISKSSFKNKYEKSKIEVGLIDAVKYLHSLGYAHCDIRAENVFLDNNMNAKLGDFGCCQYCKNDKSIYFKNDIWSIGAILYILSEGKQSSKLKNVSEHLLVQMENKKLKNLIEKCTHIDLNKRPSIEELSNDDYFSITNNNNKNDISYCMPNNAIEYTNSCETFNSFHFARMIDLKQSTKLKEIKEKT